MNKDLICSYIDIWKPGLHRKVYQNYRPISNLKFLEKAAAVQVKRHLDTHDLHAPKHSGYRKFYSTL